MYQTFSKSSLQSQPMSISKQLCKFRHKIGSFFECLRRPDFDVDMLQALKEWFKSPVVIFTRFDIPDWFERSQKTICYAFETKGLSDRHNPISRDTHRTWDS